MGGVAHQYHVAAIEGGNQVCIQGPPKMCARKVSDAEEVRYRIRPMTNQAFYECLAGQAKILIAVCWRRKTAGIKLNVPDNVLTIHGQNAHRDAAAGGMKFIEVIAGPLNCAGAMHQPDNFLYLSVRCGPARKKGLPGS